MSSAIGKAAIIVVLLAAIVGVLTLKGKQPAPQTAAVTPAPPASQAAPAPAPRATTVPAPKKALVQPAKPPSPTPSVKTNTPEEPKAKPSASHTPTLPAPKPSKVVAVTPAKLPRLLELGADKCVPCKMMQPVLEELRKDYAGKLKVDFIDVWKDPSAGESYGVQAIPTQIFFNADGVEIFRHTGFYPKEDILAKFAEFGVTF